jgi:hypothetical protein
MLTLVSPLAVSVLSVGLLVPSFQARPLTPVREDVSATVKDAVRVLDAKEYKTFLLEFFPPDFVKKELTSPAVIEQRLTTFSTHSLGFILPKLRAAMSVAPTFDAQKTKATFRFNLHEGPTTVTMLKVGRFWYLDPYQ